jgi:D-ribose pyranase
MKKTQLLNSSISAVIAKMGHMDTLTIGDAGLPIPDGPERIDLALKKGVPDFLETLDTVLTELEVQRVIIASEMKDKNAELYRIITGMFVDVPIEEVPHDAFKKLTQASKGVIRTGECRPYANIILESGVTF